MKVGAGRGASFGDKLTDWVTGISSTQAGSPRSTNSPSRISSDRSIPDIAHRNRLSHFGTLRPLCDSVSQAPGQILTIRSHASRKGLTTWFPDYLSTWP